MPDFNVRSDSVNVEQLMDQIRARIREKRGVDYTEEQIRELATVKLQKFLDPRGVRSDLLDEFRKAQPPYEPPDLPNYAFEDSTLFDSHRGPLRFMRRLLRPILKLFFNPNPLIQALNTQSRFNTMIAEREARGEASRRASDQLYYELLHNLVLETTRLGIEVKNLSMRVESQVSRLEFNERRARALESVVVYRPSPDDVVATAPPARAASGGRETLGALPQATAPGREPATLGSSSQDRPAQFGGEGPGQRSRRRRRRRGRRGGGSAAAVMGVSGGPGGGAAESAGAARGPDAPDNQGAHDNAASEPDGDARDSGPAAHDGGGSSSVNGGGSGEPDPQ
jgi:hypothetical protein